VHARARMHAYRQTLSLRTFSSLHTHAHILRVNARMRTRARMHVRTRTPQTGHVHTHSRMHVCTQKFFSLHPQARILLAHACVCVNASMPTCARIHARTHIPQTTPTCLRTRISISADIFSMASLAAGVVSFLHFVAAISPPRLAPNLSARFFSTRPHDCPSSSVDMLAQFFSAVSEGLPLPPGTFFFIEHCACAKYS